MADDSAIIRRAAAARAAAARVSKARAAEAAKKAIRAELPKIIAALDSFIGCTGPNGFPGLAEAFAAGETGTDLVVHGVWVAAGDVLKANPKLVFPHSLPSTLASAGAMNRRLKAATRWLFGATANLIERWKCPLELLWGSGPGIAFGRGKYRAGNKADAEWITIIPPIVEPPEHARFIWCRGELASVLEFLVEAERADRERLAASLEAATAVRAADGPDKDEWGPWISLSATVLLMALDGCKSNTKRINRLVKFGDLQWRDTQDTSPPFAYWRYEARIRDPKDRAMVQAYVETLLKNRGRKPRKSA